jgi:cytochrome c oxidase subunit 3
MSSIAATPAGAGAGPMSNDRKLTLGMVFYILTDVEFVIFLFISYIWERSYNTDNGWFPIAGMRTPDTNTALILTGALVLSAVFYYIGYRGALANNQVLLRLGLLIALLVTVGTLVAQMRYMGDQQFATIDGTFASSWIMLNGYHVYHLAVGIFLGLAVTIRAFRGKYSAENHVGLNIIGYFWYWMALMPVLMAILLAVFPPQL